MSLDLPRYQGGSDIPPDAPPSQAWRLGSDFSRLCLLFGQVASAVGCFLIPIATLFGVQVILESRTIPSEWAWWQVIGGVLAFFWSAALYFVFAAVRALPRQGLGADAGTASDQGRHTGSA